jgi:hypothetical protein
VPAAATSLSSWRLLLSGLQRPSPLSLSLSLSLPLAPASASASNGVDSDGKSFFRTWRLSPTLSSSPRLSPDRWRWRSEETDKGGVP